MKIKRTAISIGTFVGAAGIMTLFVPLAPAAVVMGVLGAHEIGHYGVGKATGAQAYPPIFIPLGFFVVGVTQIKEVAEEFKSAVTLAGPMSGAAAAFGVFLLAILIGNDYLAIAALLALAYEVWSGSFGSDGRRYRSTRRFV